MGFAFLLQAMRDLQYKLCVKNMPMASKGEVTLALDKIDRVLQWTFNSDKLKSGDLDTSNLLIEVYNDYVWTVNKLIFDHKRSDPAQAAAFAGVEPPPADARPVPEFGQKIIPAHDKLSADSGKFFKETLCIGASEAILAWSKLTLAKLNVVDKVLLTTARAIMMNRYTRGIMFAYMVLLHLMLIVLIDLLFL